MKRRRGNALILLLGWLLSPTVCNPLGGSVMRPDQEGDKPLLCALSGLSGRGGSEMAADAVGIWGQADGQASRGRLHVASSRLYKVGGVGSAYARRGSEEAAVVGVGSGWGSVGGGRGGMMPGLHRQCCHRLRGGAPKGGGGGKTNQKVKKLVDDKTFGMKNKAKSKKVQQYVTSVRKQVEDSMSDKRKQDQFKARMAKREEEKRKEEEERLLYGKQEKKAEEGGDEQTVKQMMEDYEYQSSVSALGKPLHGEEGSIEHEIERLRAKIPTADKEPVTHEWFEQWAEMHNAKLERVDAIKREIKKMSGREIFEKGGMGGNVGDDDDAEESWLEEDPAQGEGEEGEEWGGAGYDREGKEEGEGGGGEGEGEEQEDGEVVDALTRGMASATLS